MEHIAAWGGGRSTGLKRNEEDKLKADMMNRSERWAPITVERVGAKCRALGMRPDDVDTVVGFRSDVRKVGVPRCRVRTARSTSTRTA